MDPFSWEGRWRQEPICKEEIKQNLIPLFFGHMCTTLDWGTWGQSQQRHTVENDLLTQKHLQYSR